MPASHLSRLAGPAAIAAGALLAIGELVILQFDVSDHVATSTNTEATTTRTAQHVA